MTNQLWYLLPKSLILIPLHWYLLPIDQHWGQCWIQAWGRKISVIRNFYAFIMQFRIVCYQLCSRLCVKLSFMQLISYLSCNINVMKLIMNKTSLLAQLHDLFWNFFMSWYLGTFSMITYSFCIKKLNFFFEIFASENFRLLKIWKIWIVQYQNCVCSSSNLQNQVAYS